ncbi:MAG: hypothetical protein HC846_07125 [Blastocatellia bacterium]|nr:hypothetical protein [Blastocatellia bacterium]
MSKSSKVTKRAAGIPLSVSLKPRPNDGNDLASDIFKAVKETEELKKEETELKVKPEASEQQKFLPETASKKVRVKSENDVNIVNAIASKDPTERLFEKSKAKELYNILINLTHKAANPTDKVRVPRSYLMANTNIKTRITLDQNLKRLENLGLIKITSIVGEQEGNLYQVNLLEN